MCPDDRQLWYAGLMQPFDPSKMDPKLLMELSQLVRELPPEKLNRMQSIMHNMMAGFDVRKEMEEFEKGLPPGFREKLAGIMATSAIPVEMPQATTPPAASSPASPEPSPSSAAMSEREARLTILRAVAEGRMSPEEAEKLL